MSETAEKRYSVYVRGFDDPYQCAAASPSKARYSAFLAYREAGYGRHWSKGETFRDFLSRVTQTLHFGPTP
jgi:hypothetical protein